MNFSERQEIISFFNDFEKTHQVEKWQCQQIKVWPILKTSLFLTLFWKDVNTPTQSAKNQSNILQSFRYFLRKTKALINRKQLNLNPVDFLFLSGVNFRENFNGKSFNKFYDPIGDFLQKEDKSFHFLEYGSRRNNGYYKNRPINIQDLFVSYDGKTAWQNIDFSNWHGYLKFSSFVEGRFSGSGFSVDSEIQKTLRKVVIWEACFSRILEQTNPFKIFLLSYYNLPCFGLLAAAKKMGIPCIDIQHGTQGNLHAAYSGYKENYNLLPDLFWLWDKKTESQLKSNLNFNHFRTVVGGNPWHSFLNNVRGQEEAMAPSILYTLQPIYPLMDQYILKVIKQTSNEFEWLIRLHPRIDELSRENLIAQLKLLGIFNEKSWDKANNTPLPLLLKDAGLHISKFSGCISEAADLGTFSIILEELGVNTYRHLIDRGMAIGCIDSNSENLLDAIRLNFGKKSEIDMVDLASVLRNLIEE